jgi:murein DD-endopeptidase MepM/ murein hydrolase activator NlpD
MTKFKFISLSFLLFLVPLSLSGYDIPISDDRKYFSPLGSDRTLGYKSLRHRLIGEYGDYRKSTVSGHKHSGIDIQGKFGETVYSIGKGRVTHIFRPFPHKTIYIQHDNGAGAPFYSVYIHIEDILVNVGDWVTENTPIARIFNRGELGAAKFYTPPHLHFEIRHNISDRGNATFKSMSIPELNKYCMDPLEFFKRISKE